MVINMSKIDELKAEVKKVIIGKDETIDKVLMAIIADGHILLEDIPGVGKTTLALGIQPCIRIVLSAHSVYSRYIAQ
jgi:MoxR-like ATPase